jgi:uncharacterized Zn finger protein
MKKAGTTWWGQRWIEALQLVLRGDSGRLARGRTYARAGRTHDLVVQGGKVTAKVTGSRAEPYAITIELGQLSAQAWQLAIAAMAAQAQFSAFRSAGTSLFPQQRADLKTHCSCPDWGDPCKHVAATYYVIGEALDSDPFLLFELRGKLKDEVLAALRAARAAENSGRAGLEPSEPEVAPATRRKSKSNQSKPSATSSEIPSVKLGKWKPAQYDLAREALPSLHFSFDEPLAHAAVLRQLGTPAAWAGTQTPADVLAPLLHAAAETARRIALAEPGDPDADKRASPPPDTESRELHTPRGRPARKRAAKRRER